MWGKAAEICGDFLSGVWAGDLFSGVLALKEKQLASYPAVLVGVK